MRTLLAVTGVTLALAVAPAAEEALWALINPSSEQACSKALGRSNVPHPGTQVGAGYGECQRHR